MTQGKIERWHQTLKNRTALKNYYLPGDLEAQINAFVAYYNHRRYTRASIILPRPTSTWTRSNDPAGKRKDKNPKPSKTVG